MAAWIVRERKRLGWKPRDVAERLGALGLTVSEDTVKVWESNADRRPSPENIEGLGRIFGSAAPVKMPAVDQSALVAAIDRQTQAISSLVIELQADRQRASEDGSALIRFAEAVAQLSQQHARVEA